MTSPIDGQDVEITRIYPNNAHLAKAYLEIHDDTANGMVAWDDATSVQVAYCTDRQGDQVISGMGPFSAQAVDAANHPGYYRYVVPASVTALLDTDALRGRVIYERFTAGANAELKVTAPCLVTEPRFAA